MDVVLHLGAHRTGVASLQSFLADNARVLEERRVSLWGRDMTRSGIYSGLIRRPDRIGQELELRGRRSIGIINVLQELLEDDGCRQLLVSEPKLLGTLRTSLEQNSLYPWLDERLRRIAPAFAERCTRIVILIRDYERFWASALAAEIDRGTGWPSHGVLEALSSQPRRWRHVVEDVAHAFPNAEVVVVPFESAIGMPEYQVGLLLPDGLAGTDTTALRRSRHWQNQSPGPWKLRRILSDRGARDDVEIVVDDGGRWRPFTSQQSGRMRAAYEEDLSWLKSTGNDAVRYAPAAGQAVLDAQPLASLSNRAVGGRG